VQPENLVDLMAQADLALGGSGTMTWERCVLGLPSLVLVTAANQERIARDLDAAGACVSLGDSARVSIESLAAAILELAAARETRRRLQAAALALMPAGVEPLGSLLREAARA
jgi:UDP-2,4-diacetamido-2,4,6-trideoxy-beta-L-altropyranose hydrolase